MKYEISSKEELSQIAKDFISNISPKNDKAFVVGLYGDLGAGKTTFTQSVAKELGVQDQIVSPTFVIEKIYELAGQKFTHFIHIDAYRLESSAELLQLGWDTIIKNKNNLIFIEWPERVGDIMPEHTKIMIKHGESENSRYIEIVV